MKMELENAIGIDNRDQLAYSCLQSRQFWY